VDGSSLPVNNRYQHCVALVGSKGGSFSQFEKQMNLILNHEHFPLTLAHPTGHPGLEKCKARAYWRLCVLGLRRGEESILAWSGVGPQ
jgi:hypothetical protein